MVKFRKWKVHCAIWKLSHGCRGTGDRLSGDSDGQESACNAGELGSILRSGRSFGEGNSNPLLCSCLENSMDRGTWQATVHEVTKSQTWLSEEHLHFLKEEHYPNKQKRKIFQVKKLAYILCRVWILHCESRIDKISIQKMSRTLAIQSQNLGLKRNSMYYNHYSWFHPLTTSNPKDQREGILWQCLYVS